MSISFDKGIVGTSSAVTPLSSTGRAVNQQEKQETFAAGIQTYVECKTEDELQMVITCITEGTLA